MTAHIIEWILFYKYLIVIPIAIVEGPVLALICGFLLRLNLLALVPTFLLLMLGDIISDIYWYCIGYYGGRKFVLKFGKFFSIDEKKLEIVERIYHQHYVLILFLSKITMGFGFAVAIVAVAGITKVPFKKYMLANILAQPIWTGTLLTVGYFLGDFYLTISKGFEAISLFAIIVIGGLLVWGLSRYMKTKFIQRYTV
jgi:membrane protein DedA with SNARE-associated domain